MKNNVIFDSREPTDIIVTNATATYSIPAGSRSALLGTIPHSLGYAPEYELEFKIAGDTFWQPENTQRYTNFQYDIKGRINSAHLKLYGDNSTGSPIGVTVRYRILLGEL